MRKSLTMASVAVLATSLAACSSTGGRKAVEEASNNAGHANTPTMTVALVTHSGPGDTFWDIVRKGAEDAAAKDNVKLEYTSDPDGSKQSNLVQQAVDKKVDGIALTLAKPDAMKGSVEAAKKAGIRVVALNGGLDDWKKMGVESYFGQDEKIAGEAAGDKLKSGGAKKVLCVIHEAGNIGLEQRCDGASQGLGTDVRTVQVDINDLQGAQSTITSQLQSDPSIDAVLALNSAVAAVGATAVTDAGSQAEVATFDLNADVIAGIQDGSISFAVDQQQYEQGYLPIVMLQLYAENLNTVGGGQPVLTGPGIVDATNVDEIADLASAGTR